MPQEQDRDGQPINRQALTNHAVRGSLEHLVPLTLAHAPRGPKTRRPTHREQPGPSGVSRSGLTRSLTFRMRVSKSFKMVSKKLLLLRRLWQRAAGWHGALRSDELHPWSALCVRGQHIRKPRTRKENQASYSKGMPPSPIPQVKEYGTHLGLVGSAQMSSSPPWPGGLRSEWL